MNTHLTSPTEFASQIDAAKARAHALREEAIRAGWNALGHALRRAWHAVWCWKPHRHAAKMSG